MANGEKRVIPFKRYSAVELMKLPVAKRNAIIKKMHRQSDEYCNMHKIDRTSWLDQDYMASELKA
jgi:hypothetical protein